MLFYLELKNMNKKKNITAAVILAAILVIVDQITKYAVVKNMSIGEYKPLIGDVFGLEYIKNTGSAWGMLSSHTTLLIILSLIIFILIIYGYKNLLCSDRYKILRICLVVVFGGAIGNLIDRIRLKYVVDFLYFKLIDFPIFNFADICVTVTLFLLILLFIFKFKNKDFDVLLGESVYSDGKYIEKKKSDDNDKNETDENETVKSKK